MKLQLLELKRYTEELFPQSQFESLSPVHSPETDNESLFGATLASRLVGPRSPQGEQSESESDYSFTTLQQDVDALTDRLRGTSRA